MNKDLIAYYRKRAAEYEKVYSNPDEQDDLRTAEDLFCGLFAGKSVLEIACGTGWWTERIARVAKSVLATDVNESVIDIARQKNLPGNVELQVADMFEFAPAERFDAVFCGFIWSHILLQDLHRFIERIGKFIKPGGPIVFIDGNPVEGTKHALKELASTDGFGNTYQLRRLADESEHLVLKNFPTSEFVGNMLSQVPGTMKFVNLRYYWIAVYETDQP